MLSRYRRWLLLWLLVWGCGPVQAGFTLETDGGDVLEVSTRGPDGTGPLFLWLLNQYGETERPRALAAALAERGATVWQVDLLDSLLLQRSSEAIRNLDGGPVAALLQAAVARDRGPVVVVAADRMAVPLLRGLRAWQERAADPRAVAGAVLFFPNLYRGTPVAGEEPELVSIVAATNMPLVVFQPALGTNTGRLPDLLSVLHGAGSPAYAWLLPGVRDYYLLQTERPQTESFAALAGPVPPEVEQAIRETPAKLLAVARLLAATSRPSRPAPLLAEPERAQPPVYGIVRRPGQLAPEFELTDARGHRHELSESLGRITLVNFWATWCPPCVHEIPSMNRLAAAYDGREFGIVSINFKEDPDHVLRFMDRVAVDFPVLLDQDGAVSARWGVFAFPSSFLLDREGRIRYSVNTAIDWDTAAVKDVIDRLRAGPP